MPAKFLSASKFEVSINKAALLDAISTGSNGEITGREVRSYVVPIIEDAQNKLIKDFYNHVITKEIKGGSTASNSSGTLGGYGNLFSFIGFERGDNPTAIIEQIFSQKISVRVRAIKSGRFRISIFNSPDAQEVYQSTPLPWAEGDGSWAEGMEKGISNLGSFLYRERGIRGSSKGSRSRSGNGIQISNTLRSSTFRTQPYISKLIKDFLKNATKF